MFKFDFRAHFNCEYHDLTYVWVLPKHIWALPKHNSSLMVWSVTHPLQYDHVIKFVFGTCQWAYNRLHLHTYISTLSHARTHARTLKHTHFALQHDDVWSKLISAYTTTGLSPTAPPYIHTLSHTRTHTLTHSHTRTCTHAHANAHAYAQAHSNTYLYFAV